LDANKFEGHQPPPADMARYRQHVHPDEVIAAQSEPDASNLPSRRTTCCAACTRALPD
jgi:hypothetical protein